MKKLSLLAVSILLAGSAYASECRVRLESTFKHNLVAGDQEVFSGADLTYTDQLKQLLDTKEGVSIVPNTIKVKKIVKHWTYGCDAYECEREEEVTIPNPDYDYKVVVTQEFNYKDPTNVFYVERKSDRYDVSLLPNYVFKTYIALLNSKDQIVELQGKKLEFNEVQSQKDIKAGDLEAKLTASINASHWRVVSSVDMVPNCDVLLQSSK